LNFSCLIIIYVYVEHSSFNLQNVFKIFKLHLWLKKIPFRVLQWCYYFFISKFHPIFFIKNCKIIDYVTQHNLSKKIF
jgi:hypothetical protein